MYLKDSFIDLIYYLGWLGIRFTTINFLFIFLFFPSMFTCLLPFADIYCENNENDHFNCGNSKGSESWLCHLLGIMAFEWVSLVAQVVICLQGRRPGFDPWVGKIPWRRAWQSSPVFLPGKSPWIEEPGGLQSMEVTKSQTQLSN